MVRSGVLLVLTPGVATSGFTSAQAAGETTPPRNGEIVISSIRVKNGNFDLYRMRADGSRLRRITSGAGFERYPRFSPDGKTIGYVSNRRIPAASARTRSTPSARLLFAA